MILHYTQIRFYNRPIGIRKTHGFHLRSNAQNMRIRTNMRAQPLFLSNTSLNSENFVILLSETLKKETQKPIRFFGSASMATARGRQAAIISIWVSILMAFLCPSIQASRPSFHGEREVIEVDKASLVSKGSETLLFQKFYQNRGSSSSFVLGSARQVPTGPDPLHHNGYPSRP